MNLCDDKNHYTDMVCPYVKKIQFDQLMDEIKDDPYINEIGRQHCLAIIAKHFERWRDEG